MDIKVIRVRTGQYQAKVDGEPFGVIYRDDREPQHKRWAAYYHSLPTGLNYFSTLIKAKDWLRLMATNAKGRTHLDRLKKFHTLLPVNSATERNRFEPDKNDFYDVLVNFIKGKGYTFDPKTSYGKKASQQVWGYIIHGSKRVYVAPHPSKTLMAGVLAHEIAHHYEWILRVRLQNNRREQLVEAVSNAILHDYGYDTTPFTRAYIYGRKKRYVNGFYEGALDSQFVLLYNAFSADLAAYLKEG